ncbi:MAG TPA: amidohydrolase [Anaerolineaceae bacterium]|uniref:5-methylthioadenosine/S-adenosylhomocysteine deaminase n=1 Tax=Anaerolinea thermophila TaxID=167964 RepID=A0A101FZ01_9CHLR|nr:MAG: 5-methylthioadenosine/S-adenosylhomocysteine deaminase [Anaerolinea thermophila]HAF61081.1 amidohydrolase [Anaerolineaceae bacterium]
MEKQLILKNAIVLTMDKDLTKFDQGAVVISGSTITAVGEEKDLLKKYPDAEVFDCGRKVLMPGFVNTHTHIAMNLIRGFSDDLRLDVWLNGYIMPVEREFVTPDFVRLGTQLGCAELIRSGVTCFLDMYYFEDVVAEATAEIGLRGVLSQTVMKYPTPDAHSYEESMEYCTRFIERWKGHELITPSVAPHAPYTTGDEILQATKDLALKYDVPLHIHISETAQEVENMRKELGMPVVPYVKKQGVFEAKTIAAHCVHIDEGEMRTLEHSNVGVAHNPSSNLKLASGIAPITRMLELGLKVGIGTDGTASNNDLDFFEEMRLASFLAKGSSGDPTVVPAQQTLSMATRIGAEAIHMEDQIGTLEAGKKADMILVDMHTLHNSPSFHHSEFGIYAQLIYAGKSTDVSDVMVNGNWLMRNHVLLHIDEDKLIAQSQEYARKMDAFIIEREKSVLSKLIAIGGASQEESFEVQAKVSIPDRNTVLENLKNPAISIIRKRHYREYDTYFKFESSDEGTVRFREDHFVEENGKISHVRSRLTLIGPSREHHYPQDVLLSRSRYLAPATQSLRFYREYFKPFSEIEIEKDRLRYLIEFEGEEFFINLDKINKPDMGSFLEIKARTWSMNDAEEKSEKIGKLMEVLGTAQEEKICKDYLEMVEDYLK